MSSEAMRRPDPPTGCSCSSGFACIGASTTCVKQPRVGETCTPDGVRCIAGATCRDGTCVSNGDSLD